MVSKFVYKAVVSLIVRRSMREHDVHNFFNNKANILFTYEDDSIVEWYVTSPGPGWIPREWFDHYTRPDVDEETELALKAIYLGDATTTMRIIGGKRPDQLFACRYCAIAVFGSADLREQHIFSTHRDKLAKLFM